jgi:hypothetical protein
MRSDHAILHWQVRVSNGPPAWITLKQGSKAGEKFICQVQEDIGQLEETYASKEQVHLAAAHILQIFTNAWNTHAALAQLTSHSKSWWTEECSDLHKKIHSSRNAMQHHKQIRDSLYKQEAQENLSALTMGQIAYQTQCISDLASELLTTQSRLKGAVRKAKHIFFDEKISKLHSQQIWDAVP